MVGILRPERGEPCSELVQETESKEFPGPFVSKLPIPGLTKSETEMVLPIETENSAGLGREVRNHSKGRICKNHWEDKFNTEDFSLVT